jgi:hypothetical protein
VTVGNLDLSQDGLQYLIVAFGLAGEESFL